MTIRNLIRVGLLGAILAASAGAQSYDERRDINRDLRRRDELVRIVEADRRAVEHERAELCHSNFFSAGHERRELRRAEERLDRDLNALRAVDQHIYRDRERPRGQARDWDRR
jgi:hypothetical protein